MAETSESELRYYLATVVTAKGAPPPGYAYNSFEQFVLQYGKYYQWRPRPRGIRKMPAGQCYGNAQKLAFRRGLTYCEGFAMGIWPMMHAWCLDAQGQVVEATWQECAGYLGVSFSLEYIMQVMVRTGYHVSMIDNFQEAWPLLRGLPERTWLYDYGEQTPTTGSGPDPAVLRDPAHNPA